MVVKDDNEPILRITDLTVDFHESIGPAVNHVSFDIAEGRILAIVGESGSGKSVTAQALLSLLPAYASVTGSLLIRSDDGRDEQIVHFQDAQNLRRWRARTVALVFQDPFASLDPVFTVYSQIVEAIEASNPEQSAEQIARRAHQLLAETHIDAIPDIEHKYPHELSGGQLQRALVALALAGAPKVLVADEPTTALDVTLQQEILDLLREICVRDRIGMAIITHDMGVVADIADDVLVMHDGTVVEQGTVDQIFHQPQEEYTRRLLDSVPAITVDDTTAYDGRPTVDDQQLPILKVENLQAGYSAGKHQLKTVITDISFDIHAHEILALVGQSGSGKSTIAKTILGLVPAQAGTILFQGKDLNKVNRHDNRKLRSKIGVVFQSPSGSLNPRLRIEDIISEPLRYVGHYSREDSREKAAELLGKVHLSTQLLSRFPSELSGGQRQRIAIARAIALDPQLLIADEPTSALDVSVQSEILGLLTDLQSSIGFACLFISHDLALVNNISDRIIVLRNGRIVEAGTTHDVFTHPKETYTRELLLSTPVADPEIQRQRRKERLLNR